MHFVCFVMNSLNTWLLVILLRYAISSPCTQRGKKHTQNNLYSVCLQQTYPFKFKGHLIFILQTTRATVQNYLPQVIKPNFNVVFLFLILPSSINSLSLLGLFFSYLLACTGLYKRALEWATEDTGIWVLSKLHSLSFRNHRWWSKLQAEEQFILGSCTW